MPFPSNRVLYVEDDPDTLELVSFVLNDKDCQVIAAVSPEQALNLAKAERFDLYLLDNWIPGLGGPALCAKLREFDSDTPILFYSGAAFEEDKREALAQGAQGYLIKPCSPEIFVAEVFRLITESRIRTALVPLQ